MHKLVNNAISVVLGIIVGIVVVATVLYVFIRAIELSMLGGK